MEVTIIPFFPLPHRRLKERYQGILKTWPDQCQKCNKLCESNYSEQLVVCPHGLSYLWFDKDMLIFGLVIADPRTDSPAQTKARRKYSALQIRRAFIEEVRQHFHTIMNAYQDQVRSSKNALIESYIENNQFKDEFVDLIKPEIQKSFAVLHDYKSFISKVISNLNVILIDKYKNEDINSVLKQANNNEKAIYWSARLMEEKLRTFTFFQNPERILDSNSFTVFRFHGSVKKYMEIYQSDFNEKKVKLIFNGESYGDLRGNSKAIGIIPHTLIDNAFKYSLPGSEVRVIISESRESIEFTVESYGPKIYIDEYEKIFSPFYRGRAAIKQGDEGAGFGLYLAQLVAKKIGTRIVVTQEQVNIPNMGHKTKFSVRFTRFFEGEI